MDKAVKTMKTTLLGWARLLAVLTLGIFAQGAAAALTIQITGGAATQIPVAIVPFAGEVPQPQSLTGVISADLARTGEFRLVDPAGVNPQPHQPAEVNYPAWQGKRADALVIGTMTNLPDGRVRVDFRLMDVAKQAQLAGYSYTILPAQLRATAHRIADAIYQTLTGVPGIFSTRIAYVLKRGKRSDLVVADADGYNAQTIVSSNQPIISPAWSPDGNSLAYVSFETNKPVVYVQSLLTGKRHVLANFRGSNSGPAWAPDGNRLAVVLTKDGSSQIYLINADGKNPSRLTYSSGIDTEPNWSPDGQSILFTSDRGGSPQVYRMAVAGGPAQRMTFEGSYNVSPHYSPDGKSFVFMRRSSGHFNIAVQDMASGQMQVLTNGDLDESPSFAPNGKMILYATRAGGRGILATVSSDGRTQERLTEQGGDVTQPVWGPFLKQ